MKQKNKKVALILSFFLGPLGADRFYLGFWKSGFIKFLTLGGCFVWWLIDLYNIASGRLKPKGGWISTKTATKTFNVRVGMTRDEVMRGFGGDVQLQDGPKFSEKYKDDPKVYQILLKQEAEVGEKLKVEKVLRWGLIGGETIDIGHDGKVRTIFWSTESAFLNDEDFFSKNNVGLDKFESIKQELTSIFGKPEPGDESNEWEWQRDGIKRSITFEVTDTKDYRDLMNYYEGNFKSAGT